MEDGQREPDSYHAGETIVRETENEVTTKGVQRGVPVEVAVVEETDVRYDRRVDVGTGRERFSVVNVACGRERRGGGRNRGPIHGVPDVRHNVGRVDKVDVHNINAESKRSPRATDVGRHLNSTGALRNADPIIVEDRHAGLVGGGVHN